MIHICTSFQETQSLGESDLSDYVEGKHLQPLPKIAGQRRLPVVFDEAIFELVTEYTHRRIHIWFKGNEVAHRISPGDGLFERPMNSFVLRGKNARSRFPAWLHQERMVKVGLYIVSELKLEACPTHNP